MKTAADLPEVRRYTQEYERLRSQVNGAAPGALTQPLRGIGLALLLRDGLPAWIQAVRQVLSQAAASAAASGAGNAGAAHSSRAPTAIPPTSVDGSGGSTSSRPLVEPARQRDITTLLASLVLSARRVPDAAPIKEPSPCH